MKRFVRKNLFDELAILKDERNSIKLIGSCAANSAASTEMGVVLGPFDQGTQQSREFLLRPCGIEAVVCWLIFRSLCVARPGVWSLVGADSDKWTRRVWSSCCKQEVDSCSLKCGMSVADLTVKLAGSCTGLFTSLGAATGSCLPSVALDYESQTIRLLRSIHSRTSVC